MCDRTQEEILARELTYQRSYGISENRRLFVDDHYKKLMITAKNILKTLSKHRMEPDLNVKAPELEYATEGFGIVNKENS